MENENDFRFENLGSEDATFDDLDKLQNADLVPLKWRLYYRILYNSSMRGSELLNIKRKHLIQTRQGYFIILERQKSGRKNDRTPIVKDDFIDLIDYSNYTKKGLNDYIFTGQRGKHNIQWANKRLAEHCELVGIERHLTTHSFRKGNIVSMRDSNIPYAEISEITRHKNLKVMSDHYNPKRKKHAYNLAENFAYSRSNVMKSIGNANEDDIDKLFELLNKRKGEFKQRKR
jgi:integrase